MTFQAFRFDPVELPHEAVAFRREVRAFLGGYTPPHDV